MKRKFIFILLGFVVGLMVLVAGLQWFLIHYTLKSHPFKVNPSQQVLILGDSHPACAIQGNENLIHLAKSGEAWYYAVQKGKYVLQCNPEIHTVVIELNEGQLSSIIQDWIWDDEHVERAMKSYFAILPISYHNQLAWKHPMMFLQKYFLSQKRLLTSIQTGHSKSYFQEMEWGGHEKNQKTCSDSLVVRKFNSKQSQISPVIENVQALHNFVDWCQSKHIAVLLMRCPIHKTANRQNEEAIQQWRKLNFPELPFLDFRDQDWADDLFLDREHLNEKGAEKFTSLFLDSLRRYHKN